MIEDNRQKDKYGIETVVGDLYSASLPTTVNRTLLEFIQLIGFTKEYRFKLSFDIGCGYGRLIPYLILKSELVHAMERDEELRIIAKQLNPDIPVIDFNFNKIEKEVADFVLTYTVCQHLNHEEFIHLRNNIVNLLKPGGLWLVADNFYKPTDFKLPLIKTEDRIKEATNPNPNVGQLMLFKKE